MASSFRTKAVGETELLILVVILSDIRSAKDGQLFPTACICILLWAGRRAEQEVIFFFFFFPLSENVMRMKTFL